MINQRNYGDWITVSLSGHTTLDFDRRKMRPVMSRLGREVRREARRIVSRRDASGADEFPGRRTGNLRRSINYKVTRPGLLVRIAPYRIDAMQEFYPAFLHYGVKQGSAMQRLAPGAGLGRSNRRARGQRAAERDARAAQGWRVAPRANYMVEALERRREASARAIAAVLPLAVTPRR